MVIYAGKQTKIYLNQGNRHLKYSVMERKLNYLLLANVALILIVAGIMTSQLNRFLQTATTKYTYLYPDQVSLSKITGEGYASYYILLNSFVPIAIIVTIEFTKMVYTSYLHYDIDMTVFDEQTGEIKSCSVQNMTLHEELGQINYILCDKTGTLT